MISNGWMVLLLPVMGIMAHMALLHVGVWLGHRQDRVHIWVAAWFVFSLAFVIARMAQLASADMPQVLHLVRLQYAFSTFLGVISLVVAAHLAGQPLPGWARRALMLGLPPLLGGLWVLDTSVPTDVHTALGLPFPGTEPGWYPLTVGTVACGMMVAALLRLRRARHLDPRERNLLGAALLAATVMGMHDVALFKVGMNSVPLLDVGFLLVGLAFTWLLVHRYSQLKGGLEVLVAERTRELESRGSELVRAREAAEAGLRLAQQQGQALARSEAVQRQLMESLPDGMVVTRKGELLHANPRALALLRGTDDDEPPPAGTPLEDLVAPRNRQAFRAALDAPASELVLQRGGGPPVFCDATRVATEFEGAPAELLVLRDQTEQRELRMRLQRTQRLASLGTLAAGVAHEINNPLTFVYGNAALLREDLQQRPDLEADVLAMVDDILAGAERVKQIVQDMTALSRPTDPASLAAIHPHGAVEIALRMTHAHLHHHARVTRDLQPTPPVRANEVRLGQVITNLVTNAVQAPPRGALEQHEIHVTVRPGNGRTVVIEVKDNGAGIPPDVLPHIFDPFFTTKEPGVGTGLGLAVSHSIISSMGGTLEADSTVGAGTCMRVTLPALEDVAVLEGGVPVPAGMPDTPAARVLVVDDERHITGAFVRALARHHVEVAHSAAEALEIIRKDSAFDVIFCDLMMPVMTGMALHEEVLRLAPGLEPRFVFVTGGAFTDQARAFLARPGIRTLYKPFNVEAARRAVDEVAAQGRSWSVPKSQ